MPRKETSQACRLPLRCCQSYEAKNCHKSHKNMNFRRSRRHMSWRGTVVSHPNWTASLCGDLVGETLGGENLEYTRQASKG